jgi:signal transduction histidine kinase
MWATYLGVPTQVRTVSDDVRQIVHEERRDLVQRRITFAIWFGIFAYLLSIVELWFDFRDTKALAIQLSAELALLGLAILALTSWGKRHRLTLFHAGYALVLVAYEVTVCYKRAFGTIWGDGFTEYFMFYCLLIPASVQLTASIGIAAMLLMSVPESLLTGSLGSGAISFVGNITSFFILLGSRVVANGSWENEKLAQHAETIARECQAETIKLQLDFISAVSHELRNPLTVLCLTSEQLLSGKISEPDFRTEHYRMLQRESERLKKRVEGLLAFGRSLSPAGVEHQKCFIDPVELVDSVVREFKDTDSAPDYELSVSPAEDTPLIEGDATALSTAVWNLLDNAVKYSPDCKKIWVELGREGENAYVRVRDRGRGIVDTEFDRVFDKYVRGESSHHTTGTGIGLAIVRHVVTAHGGTIRLESRVGQGSSFTLVLPSAQLKTRSERA